MKSKIQSSKFKMTITGKKLVTDLFGFEGKFVAVVAHLISSAVRI